MRAGRSLWWWAGASALVSACQILGGFDDPQPAGDGTGGAAGEGGDGGSAGAGVDPQILAAASAWGTAECERLFACQPMATVSRYWGDTIAECAERRAGYMTRALTAPGTSSDLSYLQACTAALEAATCEQWINRFMGRDGTQIPECYVVAPGERADGDPCVYNHQCQTGYCLTSAPGVCGRCRATVQQAEAPCQTAPCEEGLGLLCTAQGCVLGKREGETCSAIAPCFDNFICEGGVCVPYDMAVGTPCVPTGQNCSWGVAGLVCNNQSFECEPIVVAAAEGDICGLGIPSGGAVLCEPGLLCDMDTPSTPNPFSGRCIEGRPGRLGDPCSFVNGGANGPPCGDPDLSCREGICGVDDPATCM